MSAGRCRVDARTFPAATLWQVHFGSPRKSSLSTECDRPCAVGLQDFLVVQGAGTGLTSAMLNPRLRFLAWALAAIVGIWSLAMMGHWYFESRKITADKVHAYVGSVDFGRLGGPAREKALKRLEDMLNALSYQERQRLREQRLMNAWFGQMTEDEKTQFVETTLPAGFKQMINAFEQLPEDKRRHVIDDALKNLRAGNTQPVGGPQGGTNGPPPISPELEAKIRTIGLKAFYSQSSAQTKAEAAPLLEEMQRQMESGRLFRRQQ